MRTTFHRSGSCWVLVSVLLLGASAAPSSWAQPPPSNEEAKEAARAAANLGQAHYDAGRYEAALRAFLEAERRFSAPTIRLMIARAHDRLGRLLEARDAYRSVVEEHLAHYAPQVFFEAQVEAKRELDQLLPRIPALHLRLGVGSLGADQGVTVMIDGSRPDLSRPVLRNPGRTEIVVSAPGRAPLTRVVWLKEGAQETMELRLEPPPDPPRPPERPAGGRVPGDSPEVPGGPSWALIGGGIAVGGTLMVAGIGLLAAGASTAGAREEVCSSEVCPDPSAQDRWQELDAERATLMNVGVWSIIGAGLVGAGTVGYVVWNARAKGRSQSAVSLAGKPGGVLLMVSGSW